MGKVKIAAALVCLAAVPAAADPVERWRLHIEDASARFGIPTDWIERVISAESGGQKMLHGRPIVSHAGAMGLMQLMPGTWAEMRNQLHLGYDPHDPRDNILAGTFYLRQMYDRFGFPGLFAAYNAGPARYAGHLAGRSSLPGETRSYMARLSAGLTEQGRLPPVAPGSVIFFVVGSAMPESDAGRGQSERIFARLRGAYVRKKSDP